MSQDRENEQIVYFLYRDANLGAGPQLSTGIGSIDLLSNGPPILHWFNFCNGYDILSVEGPLGEPLTSLGPNSLLVRNDPSLLAAIQLQQGERQFNMDPGSTFLPFFFPEKNIA